MAALFGFQIRLPPALQFLGNAYGSFLVTILAWGIMAALTWVVLRYLLHGLVVRLPGEIADVVFELLRKPLLFLIVAYGIVNSLRILPLSDEVAEWLTRVFDTVLIAAVVYFLWHIIRDVLAYYGGVWARNTESRVDDVAIPLINLFGPLFLIVAGALLILPLWGVNVTSVLLGAGVIGLVLGLALQDTLSNIFSGMSLLIEAPFRTCDLIILPDGKICEVQRIGLRSTTLYSLDQHSTVYVPNKTLSNSMIVNITKPTSEEKVSLEFTVDFDVDVARMQQALRRIACAHPCVLVNDLEKKIPLMEERIVWLELSANVAPAGDGARERLAEEIAKSRQAIDKLRIEGQLDCNLDGFRDRLRQLSDAIARREQGGFSSREVQELQRCCIDPADEQAQKVVASAEAWSKSPDPWAGHDENETSIALWQDRNARLINRWSSLKSALNEPWQHMELRLDDATMSLLQWIGDEYKLQQEAWKNPLVSFKDCCDSRVTLELWFYIDNVRLEHYGRARRVTTEVARQAHDYIRREKHTRL